MVERTLKDNGIILHQSVLTGLWHAECSIERAGSCSGGTDYDGQGDTPEEALAALKKAVRRGEEGRSW